MSELVYRVGVLLLALFAVASVALWVRKRSWTGVLKGPPLYAAVGAAAGLLGLVLSVAVGTPLVERVTDQAVQWSMYPIVRGSPNAFAMVALLVTLRAVAAELVLRGFVVDYLLERRMPPAVAILAGALAEAALSDGDLAARIGAGVFGIAMGWMFVAAGRSATPTLCARVVFSLGAVALEAARLVG